MGAKPSVAILDHFSALSDPRERWRVVYPLAEILLLVLCATLSGMDDFVEIRLWGEQRLDFLRRFLPYERGLPAHDTLNDVINALDADLFKACFTDWVEALRDRAPDIIAVDGKTSRRSHARGNGREPLHLVSAWASRQRLVLGQEATDIKSNEITADPTPARTPRADRGAGHHRRHGDTRRHRRDHRAARRRLSAGAQGQPGRRSTPMSSASSTIRPPAMIATPHETTDGDHGRIEERRHVVCHDVAWLWSDRRYAGEPRFPHLAMIGMVETRTERDGKTQRERRYYLCSAKLDAKSFAAAVRAHWHIENRLHWVLDVVFHDDLARLRTGAGPQNMAIVKHMAMNLVRAPNDKHSLKIRRKLANLNPDYLEKTNSTQTPVNLKRFPCLRASRRLQARLPPAR